MSNRGQLAVGRTSWHYRWYMWWQRKSGKTRSTLDLCHYVRVLLIWAPLRWFFTASRDGVITPVVVVVTVTLATFVAYSFTFWTELTMRILAILGACIVGVALLVWIGWLLHKAGAWKALGRRLVPIGEWLRRPRAFGKSSVTPLSAFALVFLTAGLTAGFITNWAGMLIVLGMIVGAVVVIGGVVGSALWFQEHKQKQPQPTMSGARTVWSFVVAKKHRVCPLIKVRT